MKITLTGHMWLILRLIGIIFVCPDFKKSHEHESKDS